MIYFSVMRLSRYANGFIAEEWFLHFLFESKYNGEEDCSQHDDDLWDAFWELSNVKSQKEFMKPFCSPSSWNYIRLARDVNITPDMHLTKWVQSSPFFYEGKWQRFPKTT